MSKFVEEVSEMATKNSSDRVIPHGLQVFDRGVPWVKFKLDREMVLLDRDVGQTEGKTLVDVGVGWGDYLHYYVTRGFRVIALDSQPEDLNRVAMLTTHDGSLS